MALIWSSVSHTMYNLDQAHVQMQKLRQKYGYN